MTYEEAVNANLMNCFDENGNYIVSSKYIDPDDFTGKIILVTPKIIFKNSDECSIRVKSDGLLSITKFAKIRCLDDKMSDKDYYSFFREEMKDCLIWPVCNWSLNQARARCGKDDRLDIMLHNLHMFYELCEDYDGNLDNFRHKIFQNVPTIKKAILNDDSTLKWLCSFENFENFIDERKLKAFVDIDKNNSKKYITKIWDNYYCELYNRTNEYKKTVL